MYTNSILAITGVLVAAVAAVPRAEFQHHHQHHPKRDLVWVTKYEEVIETVPVTKTVWVEPGETVPTPYSMDVPKNVKPAAYTAPAKPPVAAYNPPVESKPAKNTPAPVYQAPSSTYVAPAPVAPTTEAYVAPAPSSTYVAPPPYVAPAPSSAPAPAPAPAASSEAPSYGGGSSGGSSGGEQYSGDFTWYEVGLGACGFTSTSDEDVVAVSHVLFDAVSTGNSNTNPLCNKKITITGADGNSYTGTIVDRCPSCLKGSLDLSDSFFKKVTNNGDGRVLNMKWSMG